MKRKGFKKIISKLLSRERINSLNIYLFLGFNLGLVSILGFIFFKSSIKSLI